MKKLILILASSVLALTAAAQNKGDMYISGNLSVGGGNSISIATTEGQTSTTVTEKTPGNVSFEIAPQFGYFVIDNLEVNISLGYSLGKNYLETENNTKLWQSTGVFAISPGIKYYVKICDKFYYTPGLNFGFGFGRVKEDLSADTIRKSPLFAFGLEVSVLEFEFKPCEHFGIMFSAGSLDYTFAKATNKNTVAGTEITTKLKNNSVSFDLNTTASIGFKYYF